MRLHNQPDRSNNCWHRGDESGHQFVYHPSFCSRILTGGYKLRLPPMMVSSSWLSILLDAIRFIAHCYRRACLAYSIHVEELIQYKILNRIDLRFWACVSFSVDRDLARTRKLGHRKKSYSLTENSEWSLQSVSAVCWSRSCAYRFRLWRKMEKFSLSLWIVQLTISRSSSTTPISW